MKKILSLSLVLLLLTSCNEKGKENFEKNVFLEVKKEDYELIRPLSDVNEVLVLFGGYPERVEDIKREFKINEIAKQYGVSVLYMTYNQKLWLEEVEKEDLAQRVQNIFEENELPKSKIYFGGYSSGGNMALLLSDYLVEHHKISPKGVFVIDSPIELAALYRSSVKNIERNFSMPSVQESTWIIETLSQNFGHPDTAISNYEAYSIFTLETKDFNNLNNLKDVKIRFYTEPDTAWWKKNRMADPDQMNAYYLERLANILKDSGFKQVEYIPTENQGYRANGDRHPHSWSIVDKEKLMDWVKD